MWSARPSITTARPFAEASVVFLTTAAGVSAPGICSSQPSPCVEAGSTAPLSSMRLTESTGSPYLRSIPA